MPSIKESELSGGEYFIPCVVCQVNAGDIFMCGEGMVCTECFSRGAGIEESQAFDEEVVTDASIRNEVRNSLKETFMVKTVELYKDVAGQWRWRAIGGNGEVVTNSEGYTRKWSAKRTAKKLFPEAVFVTK